PRERARHSVSPRLSRPGAGGVDGWAADRAGPSEGSGESAPRSTRQPLGWWRDGTAAAAPTWSRRLSLLVIDAEHQERVDLLLHPARLLDHLERVAAIEQTREHVLQRVGPRSADTDTDG